MDAKLGTPDRDNLNFGCLTPRNKTKHAQTLMSVNSMKHGVFIETTDLLTEKSEELVSRKEDYLRENVKQ